MLTAFGKFCFSDGDILQVSRLKEVTLTQEVEEKTVDAFPFNPGALQQVDSAVGKETWKLKVSTGSFDDTDLAFVFDRKIQEAASIVMPEVKLITVPATSPYTVTETGLTVDQEVTATLLASTGNIQLEQIASAGTPAAGQFEVTANTLTFTATEAGKSVAIFYLKTFTTRRIIGGTTTQTKFGKLKFFGVADGPRISSPDGVKIYIPEVTRSSGLELAFADETTAELEYNLSTPAGWSDPYLLDFGAAA